MALMHQTTMSPTKLELLAAWLPAQPWFSGDVASLASFGGYRLDDPAGEVGLEGLLVTAGDATVYHVPLSYRGEELAGGEAFLIGTSEHGVLGRRWIADAAGDPVYRAALATTIAHGGRQADEFVQTAEGERVARDPRVRVRGSGEPGVEAPDFRDATVEALDGRTRIEADLAVLEVVRAVDLAAREAEDQLSLRATWPGQPMPAILALLYTA